MYRFAVVFYLMLTASLVAPLSGPVARATGTTPTPIETIPVVRRSNITTLSSSHADSFQGFTLDHGYHFTGGGSIVLNLGGAYTEFDGTAYWVGSTCCASLVFQDASNPTTGIRQLSTVPIPAGGQRSFKVKVRGITRLSIVLSTDGCEVCFHPDTDLVGAFVGSPRYVVASYPSANTVIPTNTSVVFLWHGFPGAAAYLLHVWLVKQSGTTAIGPTTRVFLSQLIFGHTSYTWDNRGFLPGTYQFDLLPLDRYGNALAGRNPAIQFAVAQSS